MDEIVGEFLIESRENLDRLDQELVKLETDPRSKDLLGSIFRTIHTIKGSCGFLGFPRLEKVAHAGESLLSRVRDGELSLSAEVTSGLLVMVDAVRRMLSEIQSTEHDGENDYPELLEELNRLQTSGAGTPSESPPTQTAAEAPTPALAPAGPITPPSPPAGSTPSLPEVPGHDGAADTIRVSVAVLDRLILMGELVLARNQLLQFSRNTPDAGLQTVSQHLNRIVTELREEVMKTRMQPIGNLWSKFPRTVRDLAHSCGKEVRLEMQGQDTDLDRTIIEAVKDPLTHLVRNAVDHGIESPEERRNAGKDVTGILKLRAFHEGGRVNIEISDDGAGLNRERIQQKAIERGLITVRQAARMSDGDIFHLVFLPGFSTAEKVTNVSGRGVGLDVVKTNVEKIGGTVDIQSVAGRGTTVRVKIPLTLAIIQALIVTSGGERFAIPQVSVSELVRLKAGESGLAIQHVHSAPVYRLRGRLLPLIYLNRELELPTSTDATRPALNIVVLRSEARQFGLIVDEITDTEEIVVKPLGKQLQGISAYSGAAIMGDGKIALILDVRGLARQARIVPETQPHVQDPKHADADADRVPGQRALLIVENGLEARIAIPLSVVARLEEFPITRIERAGAQEVLQYRGQILPLLRLSKVVPATTLAAAPDTGSIQVIVCSEQGRTVGLVVDRIVDIVEDTPVIEPLAPRTGILGSFVTQRRVTDLLDVPEIVRTAFPGLLNAAEIESERS